MKKMLLAAMTVLSIGAWAGAGVANAQSFAHEMPPQQQTANQ
jgi:hypothetical protein